MNKKIFVGGILVGAIVIYFALEALVSDETRIRRLLDNSVEGFNAAKAGSAVAYLADDYRDESHRVTKTLVQQFLLRLFLRKQNNVDGRFRYPAKIDEDSLEITVDAATATIRGTARLGDLRSEVENMLWEVEIELDLENRDGDWLIIQSRFNTLQGRRPF